MNGLGNETLNDSLAATTGMIKTPGSAPPSPRHHHYRNNFGKSGAYIPPSNTPMMQHHYHQQQYQYPQHHYQYHQYQQHHYQYPQQQSYQYQYPHHYQQQQQQKQQQQYQYQYQYQPHQQHREKQDQESLLGLKALEEKTDIEEDDEDVPFDQKAVLNESQQSARSHLLMEDQQQHPPQQRGSPALSRTQPELTPFDEDAPEDETYDEMLSSSRTETVLDSLEASTVLSYSSKPLGAEDHFQQVRANSTVVSNTDNSLFDLSEPGQIQPILQPNNTNHHRHHHPVYPNNAAPENLSAVHRANLLYNTHQDPNEESNFDQSPQKSSVQPPPYSHTHQNYEAFGFYNGSTTDTGSLLVENMRKLQEEANVDIITNDDDNINDKEKNNDNDDDEDDDSLFDFEDKHIFPTDKYAARKAAEERRERRVRRLMDEDETSVETDFTNLQQRTQQAFRGRRERSNPPIVSFDKAPDIVHHFISEPPVEDPSLVSEYTKSMESEVEDLFKDLLFIGDGSKSKPGRRNMRTEGVANGEPKQTEQQVTGMPHRRGDEDSTLNTSDDGTNTLDDYMLSKEPKVPTEEKSNPDASLAASNSSTAQTGFSEDPLSSMWGMMEGGVSAMSEAFGISPTKEEGKTGEVEIKGPMMGCAATEACVRPEGTPRLTMKTESNDFVASAFRMFMGSSAATEESKEGDSAAKMTKENESSVPTSTLTTNVTRGRSLTPRPAESQGASETPVKAPQIPKSEPEQQLLPELNLDLEESDIEPSPSFDAPLPKSMEDKTSQPEEEDASEKIPGLSELAYHTALNMHEVHGLIFDVKARNEVVNEVSFSVVKLGLPLGILFQENDLGCWVAEIFAHGNASKLEEGKLGVGDQLVTVDGKSAVEVKINEICQMVSGAKDKSSIELTFLRYTGPMRPISPSPATQEGYELYSPSLIQIDERTDRSTARYSHQSQKNGSSDRLSDSTAATGPTTTNDDDDEDEGPLSYDSSPNKSNISTDSTSSASSTQPSSLENKPKEKKKGGRFRLFGRGLSKKKAAKST